MLTMYKVMFCKPNTGEVGVVDFVGSYAITHIEEYLRDLSYELKCNSFVIGWLYYSGYIYFERMGDISDTEQELFEEYIKNDVDLFSYLVDRQKGKPNRQAIDALKALPSAQTKTCEGCKHLGKWENEVEYGYPSPCTCCKRRVEDDYER